MENRCHSIFSVILPRSMHRCKECLSLSPWRLFCFSGINQVRPVCCIIRTRTRAHTHPRLPLKYGLSDIDSAPAGLTQRFMSIETTVIIANVCWLLEAGICSLLTCADSPTRVALSVSPGGKELYFALQVKGHGHGSAESVALDFCLGFGLFLKPDLYMKCCFYFVFALNNIMTLVGSKWVQAHL